MKQVIGSTAPRSFPALQCTSGFSCQGRERFLAAQGGACVRRKRALIEGVSCRVLEGE